MLKRLIKRFVGLLYKVGLLLGTALLLGLSLLPLSVLLFAFPAIVPQESVLNDTISDKRSWLRRTLGRFFSLITAVAILLGLMVLSVEIVTQLPLPEKGSFAVLVKTMLPAPSSFMGEDKEAQDKALAAIPDTNLRKFLATPVHKQLPPAMVQHWQFVILTMYFLDVLLLMFVGKVPLAYNLRNVRVRWKMNLLTVIAFTAVIGLLSFLLAFVNGMNNMSQNSGVPGNVFVLSDGSTDEIFSNLPKDGMDKASRVKVTLDSKNRRLPAPLTIKQIDRNGEPVYMASEETYYTVNQAVPNSSRRRFLQLRAMQNAEIAAAVHNVELYPGGEWFRDVGVDNQSRIQCVLGEGIAQTLAEDQGKPILEIGDTFELGEMTWVVTGIMKSAGTTFGSEIWAKSFSRLWNPFGKDKPTTYVLRTNFDSVEAARAFAHHLTQRYEGDELKAYAEPDYYAELTKTNNTFLVATVIVAVVMAIGGVFGMMTTLFASIAQRIRDIGVLRLIGFKRWQITVSFLLESLTLAFLGGITGIAIAWLLADGRTSTSTLSGGGGGPGGKSIALTIDVDIQVMAMGMLFALAMGRIGGLVPALSAMRIKVLDSLR